MAHKPQPDDYYCVTEQDELPHPRQLHSEIQVLQREIQTSRTRQAKLKTTNAQLTGMLVSSAKSALKITTQFVAAVEDSILQQVRPKKSASPFRTIKTESDLDEAYASRGRLYSRSSSRGTSYYRSNEENNPLAGNCLTRHEIKQRIQGVKRIERKLNN